MACRPPGPCRREAPRAHPRLSRPPPPGKRSRAPGCRSVAHARRDRSSCRSIHSPRRCRPAGAPCASVADPGWHASRAAPGREVPCRPLRRAHRRRRRARCLRKGEQSIASRRPAARRRARRARGPVRRLDPAARSPSQGPRRAPSVRATARSAAATAVGPGAPARCPPPWGNGWLRAAAARGGTARAVGAARSRTRRRGGGGQDALGPREYQSSAEPGEGGLHDPELPREPLRRLRFRGVVERRDGRGRCARLRGVGQSVEDSFELR